ncbi:hypothetical protein C8R44DRAFT_800587 [Mycena epipterygia]|nr:hypothetical protein C8R44DRAFT_800587 [Mycena epipterygia]
MSAALWNFTFDDTSPFLTYTPYADGSYSGLTNGWVPWYTGSGFISTNGEGSAGDSFHLTSLDGASVNLEFHGTAAYLYGTTNSSYEIVLDNIASSHAPPTSDLLFSTTNLTEGTHSVTLTARPSSSSRQLAFDRVVISTPLVNNTTPAELFYDNTDTSMLKYSGNWSSAHAPGIPNASVSHPWQETFDAGASVTMDIGLGAIGVSLWGLADWGNWLYTVSVDGAENQYNGSTFWEVPDALLFYQGGLDPTKNHTVVLTDASNMKLALNSIRVYNIKSAKDVAAASPSGTTASPSGTSSAIAGATSASTPTAYSAVRAGVIVGPIMGVVVLALLCGFFWWRSRRNRPGPPLPSHHMAQSDPPLHRPLFLSRGYSGATLITPFTSSGLSATYPSSTTKLGTFMVRGAAVNPDDNRNVRTRKGVATSPLPASTGVATSPLPASTGVATSSVTSPVTSPADVDRLIELIVQRMDRGGPAEAAPPEYRG